MYGFMVLVAISLDVAGRYRIADGRSRHHPLTKALFHDHVPARKLGLDTAWIHRRAAKGGFGATPPAEAAFDIEVPDLESLVFALGR